MANRIDYAALLELRSAGFTASQIAARLGCSEDGVYNACKTLGIQRRTSGPTPKLSDAEITQLWHDGVRLTDIAAQCGVSTTTIYAYAKRLQLPRRPKAERKSYDPSPAEIERLKAELRERHFAERRAEKDERTELTA